MSKAAVKTAVAAIKQIGPTRLFADASMIEASRAQNGLSKIICERLGEHFASLDHKLSLSEVRIMGELLPYVNQGAVSLDERVAESAAQGPAPGDEAILIDAEPVEIDFSMFRRPAGHG